MLERIFPEKITAVHPEPELTVTGRKKELYEDTKSALKVPWMGVISMALCHYQEFYEEFWAGVGPALASQEAVASYTAIRNEVEDKVHLLTPPARRVSLQEMGYNEAELAQIRDLIEVFSHGNFPYTMMVTLARLALEAGKIPSGGSRGTSYVGQHGPDAAGKMVLMESHHQSPEMRMVYSSIRTTLGLPFVNTDYRALARWPSYFALVWSDLRPKIHTETYKGLCQEVHDMFVEDAMNLPDPVGVDLERLVQAANQSASVDEILEVARLFHWLLPGLIVNVAFFRHQLLD